MCFHELLTKTGTFWEKILLMDNGAAQWGRESQEIVLSLVCLIKQLPVTWFNCMSWFHDKIVFTTTLYLLTVF